MTSIDTICGAIKRLPDERIRDVALLLVEKLSRHLDDRNTMWTYKALSQLVGAQSDDPALIESIELLASRPAAKLLEIHFLFFNPNDDADDGTVLEDEDVAQAYVDGFLADPVSGDEIHQFEDTLVPFFQISDAVHR